MLRSYLTIALRSLARTRVHTAINIIGLSAGICCCLLIALFVKDELTFDRFHAKADRIYRAYVLEDWGENQKFTDIATPFPLGPALRDNLEEVELMVRINNIATQVKTDNDIFSASATIAGVEFLEMFDFNLISGQKKDILNDPTNLILTVSSARRFFGDANPIGRTVSMLLNDRFEGFTVKGVVQDPPTNSSIRFEMLISELNYPKLYSERLLTSEWFNITPETYITLRDGASLDAVAEKFPSIFKPLLGDSYEKSKFTVKLQPLTSIHLDTSLPAGMVPVSDPRYSWILSGVALLILVVACINFVTLSIGRSLKRSREVGIRKVSGAQRIQLIIQFVGEGMIVTSCSLAIGIIVATLCLPVFNELSGKQLVMDIDLFFVSACVLLVIIIGLLAGSYPAFILSSFKPVSVLKGIVRLGSNKQGLRKALVGIQLMFSIFLVSGTLLMTRQLSFIQNKNLGFDKEQLAVIPLNVVGGKGIGERIMGGMRAAETFKAEISSLPQVASVCASSHDFATGDWINIGYTDDAGVYRTFYYNTVDSDYATTLKLDFAEGRNFSGESTSDGRRAIVVNEAFVRDLGWTNAVGKRIPGAKFPDHEIVGVVKDFHYSSLYTRVEPLVMALTPGAVDTGIENINISSSPVPKLIVRLHAGNYAQTIADIGKIWDRLTGGEEFTFTFVDQALATQYRSEQNLQKIITIATVLSLIIGSMGLYGLASLAMQNRVKEISIRKVLGATHRSILILLTKDYFLLICGSLLFSIPLTVYFMRDWLNTFEYRVAIGADVFVFAGVISLLVALLTISAEALRAAARQPADTLKYE